MRAILALLPILAAAQTADISGTWVGKRETPMGEMEMVWRLKVDNGRITGTQTLPFGDAPIVDGKIDGNDFEFTVQTESFGALNKVTGKGKIVGDELHITPAMPAPPSGTGTGGASASGAQGGGRPAGGRPGGGGFGGGGMRAMMSTPIIARRGTPTPSYRAPSISDYSKLPKVELPALKSIPRDGMAKTPPMGWNSWNKFRTRIDDKTIREIADALVTTGMRDAGYRYLNIDDGWQDKRDESGVLRPNPNFPDMKALADYVHSKGLKLGIYSSPGPRTCGGFQGSYGHEEIDAKTWADWGIDYLKYDWCSASRIWKDDDMHAVYQRMGNALRKTGRPIVFSLCQYGRASVGEWGPLVGGHLWRTTFDIRDNWASMEQIGFAQHDWARFSAPGNWNDPDMLEVGNGGMTGDEYRTHFSLWAMVGAPLIAGNDLRSMTEETREILMNKEVIAINQDKLGKGGSRLKPDGSSEVWLKPLTNGALAVALFNRAAEPREIGLNWSDLPGKPDKHKVRDLWKHQDLKAASAEYRATVPAHGVVLLRVSH